ncbi:zinc ribbon domain-containing protein [Mycolicibacterium llatzerense]|uniref:zinc ribbon domain-containing protein n=1 Tax=Mycolicibacterium llatzerense TaxID=280871 RepID=UPI0009F28682|nr:zinc ribbon domain-containing protein [Mycolicibacterium llatzerense]
MALVACPECGRDVSDKAPTCPGCGVPIFRESKVVVYGYTQQFLINPKVRVLWNNSVVGSVKKGDAIAFKITKDGEVSFRASGRKAAIQVRAGRVTKIRSRGTASQGK